MPSSPAAAVRRDLVEQRVDARRADRIQHLADVVRGVGMNDMASPVGQWVSASTAS